ncbi:DUF6438 domain-containing protein [Neolewinella antarctica]|uniref:DUF6438 domain-containing protein n=1 Tax=Neolewinella antarctica TaxID=442734 RepID=A0ABX0XC54_9BACT|nr:DUF6438 domain-containing protein [Neolewinella antarctica]NJC26357.1 hypothetical protein [Neolewinella antarctica]
MRFALLFAAIIIVTSSSSCDPTAYLGPQFSGAKPENLRITYRQDACFGSCEVYELDVYNNGLLVFRGERFTERPGVWHKNDDRRAITSFLDSLSQINFREYPATFPSRLPDAPTQTITWYDGEQAAYPISFKEEASPELRRLADRLQELAQQPGYRQISTELPGGKKATGANEKEEIIVHLREGVVAGTWLAKYGRQGVALKEQITPNTQYYLITTNPNLMAADELLQYLRQDEDVISAQENGTVSPR